MKVFVAGATGVLGRAAVPRLIAAGHEVRGHARSPEKASQLRSQGAEPIEVDLFDPSSVRAAVDGCDAVVHMATHIPPMTRAWRAGAWEDNDRLRREGTPIMVDASRDAGATVFVKESVCFSYADGGDRPLDEEAPLDPDPRLESGLVAERSAVGFGDEATGRRGVALRFGLFYSHDAPSIDESLRMARLGQSPMVGAADAWQPSIHVDDAAAAIVAALGAPTGVYNVADEPVTKGQWATAFRDAFGLARATRPTPKVLLKAGRAKLGPLAASRRVSSRRFHEATGWTPKYPDATVGLKAVAAAWKEQHDG